MSTFTSSTIGRRTGFWLIFTAVIELGLAGLFVAIGLTAPEVGAGMFVTAVILGATGIVLLLVGWRVRSSAAANERLLAEGMQAVATVTALTQTGMYLNENPQVAIDMLVDVGVGDPYPATRKEFVPLILLGRLSSGVPLPVRVDRRDPQRLVIDWAKAGLGQPAATKGTPFVDAAPGIDPHAVASSILAATGAGAAGGAASIALPRPVLAPEQPAHSTAEPATPGAPSQPLAGLPFGLRAEIPAEAARQMATMREWLRQTGESGTARIDDATDTGVMVGNDRLFTIAATLELPGRAPEKLQPVAAMVAPDNVEKVREGYRVTVRVAPDNHQLIDFDW